MARSSWPSSSPRRWNVDIDRHLNRLVPPPPWRRVPYALAWLLGHRRPGHGQMDVGNVEIIFWAVVGIFCGVALIEGVGMHVPSFASHDAPLIVGSFGAAAVLEFYAIESPLAQPRNAVLGQLISCVVGVGVPRLFALAGDARFHEVRWAAGALSCALATAFMALTKTVHPPAGATALLAVTDDRILALGWFLIPIVLLGCVLMLVVALLVNNVARRFPVYWWTPAELGRRRSLGRGGRGDTGSVASDKQGDSTDPETGGESELAGIDPRSGDFIVETDDGMITIRRGYVCVPRRFFLRQEERQLLEILSERLT